MRAVTMVCCNGSGACCQQHAVLSTEAVGLGHGRVLRAMMLLCARPRLCLHMLT